LNGETDRVRKRQKSAIIAVDVRRFGHAINTDEVFGTHNDDQVDALGLVGQLLDKISAGPRPKPPEMTQRDDYRAAFEEMRDDSWKTM